MIKNAVKPRNTRKQVSNLDDEEAEGVSVSLANIKAAQAKRDKERQKGKAPALLSFNDDLGDDTVQGTIKAPKKARLNVAGYSTSFEQHKSQISAPGEYSSDRIQELQQNTFKLAGKFKGSDAEDDRYLYNSSAAAATEDSLPDMSKSSPLLDDYDKEGEEGDVIPYDTIIQEAKAKKLKLRARFALEEEEHSHREFAAHEDLDEEEKKWMEAQIRKGIGAGSLFSGPPPMKMQISLPLATQHPRPPIMIAVKSAAKDAFDTMKASLERLKVTELQARRNLERTEGSLEECLSSMVTLQDKIVDAGNRYTFLQGMRAYIADLCNMLEEKAPLIEELLEAALELGEGRAKAHQEKWDSMDFAVFQLAEAGVTAALSRLAHDGDGASAAEAAKHAETVAGATMAATIPVELDEFGRDVNVKRRVEVIKAVEELHYGVMEDLSAYNERYVEIKDTAEAVFLDADVDFSGIRAVSSRLKEWKTNHPSSYNDAYLSLSAPALFAPFVKLELISWRPLHTAADTACLEGLEWYQQLSVYAGTDESDAQLVPKLVSKVVLPVVMRMLSQIWTPRDPSQTESVVALVKSMSVLEGGHGDTELPQELVVVVLEKLKQAVDSASVPLWPASIAKFYERAHKCMVHKIDLTMKVYTSVVAFEGVLPRIQLQKLALDILLTKHIIPYLSTRWKDGREENRELADRVLKVTPLAWHSTEAMLALHNLLAQQ